MKIIKVMLIEDHPAYRETIALALTKEDDIELISQFGTAEQALTHLQSLSSETQPDLILLDLNLPGITGIEALPWIHKYAPEVQVLILTQSDREADVVNAISAGAAGYLLKESPRQQLANGIRNILDGGASLDPNVAAYLLTHFKTKPVTPTSPENTLSERELETLVLLSQGYLKKEIADKLGISHHTVVTFIKRIYEKLNVQNAPAAISKAYKRGILS